MPGSCGSTFYREAGGSRGCENRAAPKNGRGNCKTQSVGAKENGGAQSAGIRYLHRSENDPFDKREIIFSIFSYYKHSLSIC